MACECSQKSKCKTKRCECKTNGKTCTDQCGCRTGICENTTIVEKADTSKVSEMDAILDLATDLNQSLRVNNLTKKFGVDQIFEYTNGIDLYTRKSKEKLIEPQIDHIVEVQLLAHATARVLRHPVKDEAFLKPLRESINDFYNFNVTDGNVNMSKGQVFKAFLQDGIYRYEPIRVIIQAKTYQCEKYFNSITKAVLDAYPELLDRVESCRRFDGFVTGNYQYENIAYDLEDLFAQMDLRVHEGRWLRFKKSVTNALTLQCAGRCYERRRPVRVRNHNLRPAVEANDEDDEDFDENTPK